ncbi:MAG: SUMF1/EgtB/PvdO family nonheme iron enzyme, partial [Candidatus Cloacimonas acidaminovorans]
YDLSGNVFEWCWDYYDIYKKDKQVHPKGAEKGVYRIARGGSLNSDIDACSSTARGGFAPNFKGNNLGFRIVRNVH